MSDEYDSWRRYEDAKAFKNKLAEIDQLKDRIEKLEAGEIEFDRVIGGYASENAQFRDRIEKLEAALREIIDIHPFKDPEGDVSVKSLVDLVFHINLNARKALEGKDD